MLPGMVETTGWGGVATPAGVGQVVSRVSVGPRDGKQGKKKPGEKTGQSSGSNFC